MRTITKGPEPVSLTRHRSTPGADWDGFGHKDEARQRLCQEQRGLCAFCMGRIRDCRPSEDHECGTKVAHWSPRKGPHGDASLQLIWSNLLGCCPGGEFGGGHRHCDTAQADQTLRLHPVLGNPVPEAVLRFRASGELTSEDPAIQRDIDEVLRLNCAKLRRKRAAVVDGLFLGLDRRRSWRRSELLALRRRRSSEGPDGLPEFYLFAVSSIDKRIKQLSRK